MKSKFYKKFFSLKFILKFSVCMILYTTIFLNTIKESSLIEYNDYTVKIFKWIQLPIIREVIVSSAIILISDKLNILLIAFLSLFMKTNTTKSTEYLKTEANEYELEILNLSNPFLYSNKTRGLRE